MLAIILATALATAGSGEAAPAAEVKAKPERRICRTIENTGSRMGAQRICKKASDWDKDKEEAERFLAEKQNGNLDAPTPGATMSAGPLPH